MGASGRLADARGRGVEPLDPVPDPVPGVFKYVVSADCGVSAPAENLELLGVVLFTVCLRPKTVFGTEISDGVIASTQGLFEISSADDAFLALLSLRLSRILLDSPLTCGALVKPELLDPEYDSVVEFETTVEETLVVSIVSPRLGDRPRPAISSSTHPAGVGGTGPKFDESCGGLLVGGAIRRSGVDTLCDLDCDGGGGPGGGGGRGMPGAHLDEEEPRERDVEGVLVAPAEAALRADGAITTGCTGCTCCT